MLKNRLYIIHDETPEWRLWEIAAEIVETLSQLTSMRSDIDYGTIKIIGQNTVPMKTRLHSLINSLSPPSSPEVLLDAISRKPLSEKGEIITAEIHIDH